MNRTGLVFIPVDFCKIGDCLQEMKIMFKSVSYIRKLIIDSKFSKGVKCL